MAGTYPATYTATYGGDEASPVVVAAQHPGMAGLQPSMSAASATGNWVPPNVRLLIVNDAGSVVTLTIETPAVARGGLAVADQTVAVGTGSFPANVKAVDVPGWAYLQSDGYCHLSWSATTDVSFAVLGQVLN